MAPRQCVAVGLVKPGAGQQQAPSEEAAGRRAEWGLARPFAMVWGAFSFLANLLPARARRGAAAVDAESEARVKVMRSDSGALSQQRLDEYRIRMTVPTRSLLRRQSAGRNRRHPRSHDSATADQRSRT